MSVARKAVEVNGINVTHVLANLMLDSGYTWLEKDHRLSGIWNCCICIIEI